MVTSTSRLAYGDCYSLMDKAMADPKGIRIKFARREDAWHFRIRIHSARKIDRADNMIIYKEDEPLYGRSVYDGLTMRIREAHDGEFWLRIERIDAQVYHVESLTEPDPEPEFDLVTVETPSISDIVPLHRKVPRRL